MYYQNVRGLRTKLPEFRNNLQACNYEIIALTETWLHTAIHDSELFNMDYSVFRRDRNYEYLGCQRGGGTLIATSITFAASIIDTPISPFYDDIWVCIKTTNLRLIIGCVYFPPNSSPDCYQAFCNTSESLKNEYEDSKFLILGDFNLPLLEWHYEDSTLVPSSVSSPTAEVVIDSMYFQELHQLNSVSNCKGRFLDLVFADEFTDLSLSQSKDPIINTDPYHPPLELIISDDYTSPLKSKNEISVYQFYQANFQALNRYYNEVDWSFLETESDINNLVSMFYVVLFAGIDLHTPKKIIKNQKYPKWFDGPLRKLIAHKNKIYKRYKRTGLQTDYMDYSNIRREVKWRTDMCYLMYVSQTEHLIPENVKHFWRFINNLKKNPSLPSLMKFGDLELTDPDDIANAFSHHFQSCYSDHKDLGIAGPDPVGFASVLCCHEFTIGEVEQGIENLDTSKKAGPDGIPPLFLKNCKSSLASPLCILFQKSFDLATFPDIWKFSSLIPIFKSGDRSDICNYRGISLLSTTPKLFESIITNEIFETYSNYIIPEQHGFYRGRSTSTNLGLYQNYLISSVEAGGQVDVIYTDLSKAFDSVCHELLLEKICQIGITGKYHDWIRSYLSQRRQRVTVCGSVSGEVLATSGVPQGSHIGPVLFLLFINDVSSCFEASKCLLYADDLKFYTVVSPNSNSLQSDLNRLVTWTRQNHLQLNIKKCKVLRFHKCTNPLSSSYKIGNNTLEVVTTFSDLGVIFDSNLTFNFHIDNIVIKSLRLLGFIKRNTRHVYDTKAVTCLYNCLVRSILEYCSTIWTPQYQCHIDRIERVQNKFVKYLLYKLRFPYTDVPYETRLLLCGMHSLECRRRNALLCFLHKLISGAVRSEHLLELICFHIPTRRTRRMQLFYQRTHRTNYGQSAFVSRLVYNYNTYYPNCDIFSVSVLAIKGLM